MSGRQGTGDGTGRHAGDHRGSLGAWLDPRTLRHGLVLARVDLTRTVRRLLGKWLRVVLLLVGVAPLVLGGGYAAYRLGRTGGLTAVAADLPPAFPSVLSVARGGAAVAWVGLFVFVVVRAVGGRGSLDNDAGLLTMAPTREVALGRVLAEVASTLAWALSVGLAVAVGYGVGGGGWTFLATLPVAAVALALSAVPVAVAVGLAVRHVTTRIEVVARYRQVIGVLAFLAYFAAIATGAVDAVVSTLFETLQAAPVAWPGDLLLLGSNVGGDPLRAALVAPLVAILAAAGVVGAAAAGERHWFADPVLGGDDTTDADDSAATPVATDGDPHGGVLARVERALSGVVGPGPAALVVLAWRRAARAPMKLLYVTYPLFGGVGFVANAVESGEVPAFMPALVLVFVAWAGTVVFTLNPLGDQGSVLSTTLLSRVGGWRFAAAHVLAGALVAAPLGTVVVTLLAVAAGLTPRLVAGLALGTPLVVVLGGLFAVGVGVAFPRYDAVSVTRSTDAVVPSLLAFALHTVYLLFATVAGVVVYRPALEPFVAAFVSWLLPLGVSVTPDTVGTVAVVVAVAAVVAPLLSVRYAARRFETVTLD